MRRPQDERLTAMQFERVMLTGGGRQTALYAIEGVPGVYRRVPKSPASSRPKGNLVAYFGNTEVELVRASDIEEELAQAGFTHVATDVTRLRPSERAAVLDGLFQPDGDGGEGEEGEGAEEAPETAPASAEAAPDEGEEEHPQPEA